VTAYRDLLGELAIPRLVGSPGHAQVRLRLTEELARRGYVTLEHDFPVRPPGALAVAAYGGGALALASLGLAVWRLGFHGSAFVGLVTLGAIGLALALVRLHRPRGARLGVNVIGVRPRARVTVWLAAHYDSKGQPVSMLIRLAGAGCAAVGVITTLVLGVSAVSVPVALALACPGLLGGLVLLQNRATNESPGAVDNASALVTVLAVLDQLPPEAPIGVLFLDAEEYGLLGARALVRERPNLIEGTVVVNLDGIDDLGSTRCFVHRRGPRVATVAAALEARVARVLPAFVDGLVLGPLARECVTLMRGDWRTAAVVHTRADRAERLTLSGSQTMATALARVLASLR
jgi:hypothetical protein